MTVVQAVHDAASGSYLARPFAYTPAPMAPGRRLDEDVELYLACTARCGLMPNSLSLLFMGDTGEELYLRRAETPRSWGAFHDEVVRRHPDVAAHTAAVAGRVRALATGDRAGAARHWRPTTPELCVGAALLTALPAGVTLVADAALPGGRLPTGHVRRSDYHLVSRHHEERLEVAGLIDSAMRPRTVHGVRYKATTLVARQAAYAALGLPPPLTLYADEVLDKQRLAWIVAGIFARFA